MKRTPHDYPPQKQALVKGVHLLVGTPGRTLEHLQVGSIDITHLKILVLDEADRMLEDGFAEEMKAILDQLPTERQTLFFSATFPESMELLSKKYQKKSTADHDRGVGAKDTHDSAVPLQR